MKAETKKNDKAVEQSADTKVHKPREPQMVTVNGEKVTHGHAFQSNQDPNKWYFTARIDGQQLRPQLMKPEDAVAYQKRETTVEGLMQTYYPTKLAKKVTPEEYKADNKLSDGRIIDKMVVAAPCLLLQPVQAGGGCQGGAHRQEPAGRLDGIGKAR